MRRAQGNRTARGSVERNRRAPQHIQHMLEFNAKPDAFMRDLRGKTREDLVAMQQKTRREIQREDLVVMQQKARRELKRYEEVLNIATTVLGERRQ